MTKPPTIDQKILTNSPNESDNISPPTGQPHQHVTVPTPNAPISNPHSEPCVGLNNKSTIYQNDTEEGVSTQSDQIPRYQPLPLPTSGRLDIVITFVSTDGVISGLEASQGIIFSQVLLNKTKLTLRSNNNNEEQFLYSA